jgi:hypothetical protein
MCQSHKKGVIKFCISISISIVLVLALVLILILIRYLYDSNTNACFVVGFSSRTILLSDLFSYVSLYLLFVVCVDFVQTWFSEVVLLFL